MYHVNPKTGSAGKCKAEKGSCPFGGSDDHYTSEEAARASYERSQSGAFSSAKAAAVKRIPTPRTKSEFFAAILQIIPEVGESSVVPMPISDVKESSGLTRYTGGSVASKDANGKYRYQGVKEAVVGIRQSIAEARAAGEIPSWITTTVKNGTYHWTSPSVTITVGFKGSEGKTSIPEDWLEKSGDRPQSEAGVRLARYMEQISRQFETSHINLAIDERTVSNRGKVEWL